MSSEGSSQSKGGISTHRHQHSLSLGWEKRQSEQKQRKTRDEAFLQQEPIFQRAGRGQWGPCGACMVGSPGPKQLLCG